MRILFGILFVGIVFGAISDRPCRTVPAKENFSTTMYSGTWYELFNNNHRFNTNCIVHHYTKRGSQEAFDVYRSFVLENVYHSQEVFVSVTNPLEVPMRAVFNGTATNLDGSSYEVNYQIYATDYVNYSILWFCINVGDSQSMEFVSVLSRSTRMSDAVLAKVDRLLKDIEIDKSTFRVVPHDEDSCYVRSAGYEAS